MSSKKNSNYDASQNPFDPQNLKPPEKVDRNELYAGSDENTPSDQDQFFPQPDANPLVPPLDADTESDRPKGTWEATGPQMDDEQAHRDVKYKLPGRFSQTISVFKTQMSLFSKRKSVYILLLMAVLIPAIYYLLKDRLYFGNLTELSGNGMMGLLLFMLPFILTIFTSFLCGSLMPTEINERTAYMNMALPMSRASFCMGKYLATVAITLGVFVFAYGMAMLTAYSSYSYFDEEGLAKSFVFIILSVLVYSSFSFALGCILRRGATILSLLTMIGILPGIQFYLFVEEKIDSAVLTMFPNLLPDMTCLGLGSNITASPIGLMNLLMMGGEGALDLTQMDLMMTVLTAVIWTLAFLLIGIFAVSRREM